MPKENTQLMPLENVNAATVFKEGGLDSLLGLVEDEARSMANGLNVEDEKGRKEIASVAYKVARSKTTIDDVGKNLVAGLKKEAAKIDAERKRARDTLDDLKSEIRKPLDEWEAAEAARIDAHKMAIGVLMEDADNCREAWLERGIDVLEKYLKTAQEFDPSTFEEFEDRAAEVKVIAITKISEAMELRAKHEKEQEELEQLRREKAEREAREAEEQRQREQEAREQRIREEAAENERRAAQEREDALRREKEAEAAARQDAEERAALAEQLAMDRQRRLAEEEKAEEERRQRNTRYKGTCNSEAAEALMEHAKLGPTQARKVVEAIVKGKIPRVTMGY